MSRTRNLERGVESVLMRMHFVVMGLSQCIEVTLRYSSLLPVTVMQKRLTRCSDGVIREWWRLDWMVTLNNHTMYMWRRVPSHAQASSPAQKSSLVGSKVVGGTQGVSKNSKNFKHIWFPPNFKFKFEQPTLQGYTFEFPRNEQSKNITKD